MSGTHHAPPVVPTSDRHIGLNSQDTVMQLAMLDQRLCYMEIQPQTLPVNHGTLTSEPDAETGW